MLFMRRGEPRSGATPIDVPGAALIAVGHVPARVRPQRGRDLRVVAAAEGLHGRRPSTSGPRRARSRSSRCVLVARRSLLVTRSSGRAVRRSGATRIPCSSSASSDSRASATACSRSWSSRWASSACSSCCRCSCRTASTCPPQQNGLWLLPLGLVVIVGAQIGGRLTRRIGTDGGRCARARRPRRVGAASWSSGRSRPT